MIDSRNICKCCDNFIPSWGSRRWLNFHYWVNFSFNVELNCHHNRLQIPLSSLNTHKWISQHRAGRHKRYYGTFCYWKPQELYFYWISKGREKMKCHEDFCFVKAVMTVVSSAPSLLTTALLLHLIESEPCDSSDTPPSVSCPPGSWSLITLLCVREHHWRNVNVAPDVLALLLIVAAAPRRVSRMVIGAHPRSLLFPVRSDLRW